MSDNSYATSIDRAPPACDYCKSVDHVVPLETNGTIIRLCRKCFDRYIKEMYGDATCY